MTYRGLRHLLDVTLSCLRQLKVSGSPVEHWDDLIINILVQRLPSDTADLWEQRRMTLVDPKLVDLQQFLEGKAQGCYLSEERIAEQIGSTEQKPEEDNEACLMTDCKETHPLYRCARFKALDRLSRREILRQTNVCKCCLLPGHKAKHCHFKGCSDCPEDTPRHNSRLCLKSLAEADE